MITKSNAAAIAALFVTLATAGVVVPASAAEKPGYDACYTAAVERGSGPNRGGGTKEHSQHKYFMDQCMDGKIPLSTTTATASVAKLPANAFASTTPPTGKTLRRPAAAKY